MDTNNPASRYPSQFRSPINYSTSLSSLTPTSYNDMYQTATPQYPTSTEQQRTINVHQQLKSPDSLYYHGNTTTTHYKPAPPVLLPNHRNPTSIFDNRSGQSVSSKISGPGLSTASYNNNYGGGISFKDNYYASSYYDQYKHYNIAVNPIAQYSTPKSTPTGTIDFSSSVPSISHTSPSHSFQPPRNTVNGILPTYNEETQSLVNTKLTATTIAPTIPNVPPHHFSSTHHHPIPHNPATTNVQRYLHRYSYTAPTTIPPQHPNPSLYYNTQNCSDEGRWMWNEHQNSRTKNISSYNLHHSFPTTNNSIASPANHHSSTHPTKEVSSIYRSNNPYGYYGSNDAHLIKDKTSLYHQHQINSSQIIGGIMNNNNINTASNENFYNNNCSTNAKPSPIWSLPGHHSQYQNTHQNTSQTAGVGGFYDRMHFNETIGANSSAQISHQNYTYGQDKSLSNYYHHAMQNYSTKYNTPMPHIPSSSAASIALNSQIIPHEKTIDPGISTVKDYSNPYRCVTHRDATLLNFENSQHMYTDINDSLRYGQEIMNRDIITRHRDSTIRPTINNKEYTLLESPLNTEQINNHSYYNMHQYQNGSINYTSVDNHEVDSNDNIESNNCIGTGSSKTQNLREFLSSWNDDEDDAAERIEVSDAIVTVGTMDHNSNYCDSVRGNDVFLDQQSSNIEAVNIIENENDDLQLKDSIKTATIRRKIHVGITVDGSYPSDQYGNLPDIIIDIEKSKDSIATDCNGNNSDSSNNNMNGCIRKCVNSIPMHHQQNSKIIDFTDEETSSMEVSTTTTTTTPIELKVLSPISEELPNQEDILCEIKDSTIQEQCKEDIEIKEEKELNMRDNKKLPFKRRFKNNFLSKQQSSSIIPTVKTSLLSVSEVKKSTTIKIIQENKKHSYRRYRFYHHRECKMGNLKNTHNGRIFKRKCCKKAIMLQKIKKRRQYLKKHRKELSKRKKIIQNPLSLKIACINAINTEEFRDYMQKIYENEAQNYMRNNTMLSRYININEIDGFEELSEEEFSMFQILQNDDEISSCNTFIATSTEEAKEIIETTLQQSVIRWLVPKLSDLCKYALKCYYDKEILQENDQQEIIINICETNDDVGDDNNINSNDDQIDEDEQYPSLLFVECCDINYENTENESNIDNLNDENEMNVKIIQQNLESDPIETETEMPTIITTLTSLNINNLEENVKNVDHFIVRSHESQFNENGDDTNDENNYDNLEKCSNIINTSSNNNNNNNNIPFLDHEEIVPENYEKYKTKKLLKDLQSKYVQKIDFLRSLVINKIIKKYKNPTRKIINVRNFNKISNTRTALTKKVTKKSKNKLSPTPPRSPSSSSSSYTVDTNFENVDETSRSSSSSTSSSTSNSSSSSNSSCTSNVTSCKSSINKLESSINIQQQQQKLLLLRSLNLMMKEKLNDQENLFISNNNNDNNFNLNKVHTKEKIN